VHFDPISFEVASPCDLNEADIVSPKEWKNMGLHIPPRVVVFVAGL
jgi:hypothetical protein